MGIIVGLGVLGLGFLSCCILNMEAFNKYKMVLNILSGFLWVLLRLLYSLGWVEYLYKQRM